MKVKYTVLQYALCVIVKSEKKINESGLCGRNPAEAFLLPEGRWSDAKKTEEAVFLSRMSQAHRGAVL